jgi:hypothetical protein
MASQCGARGARRFFPQNWKGPVVSPVVTNAARRVPDRAVSPLLTVNAIGVSIGAVTDSITVILIGESEPISIVRGEPSELSSILVSASEAPFQRRFVLGLVPLESQAGRDLLPGFDRVAEFPCQIDRIHHCWLA